MKIEMDEYGTPLGAVTAAWRDGRVCGLAFSEHWAAVERALARRLGGVERAAASDGAALWARLDAYFGGDLGGLDDVAVEPYGTDFQRRVWAALRRIPPGATRSYGALAAAIDAPTAVRAVGAANGANPIWLLIPCHRAIGADGTLTGYAGGLERKRWLLEHEATGIRNSHGVGSSDSAPGLRISV